MFVKTFPVGSFQCNCTILADRSTGEAVVIDPGDEAHKIIRELASFKVKYLLHTHAHIDHIGGTSSVKDSCGGRIALHKDDLFLYDNIEMQGQFLGMHIDSPVKPVDHYLVHGDVIEWGDKNRMEVLHTPGHTPGSLSFVSKGLDEKEELLFAGDTLFLGSIGRTDLWGGDFNQIIHSIKTRLITLPETTPVVCGHGPMTTVGREKKLNPFIT